jgi:hypothetical protein
MKSTTSIGCYDRFGLSMMRHRRLRPGAGKARRDVAVLVGEAGGVLGSRDGGRRAHGEIWALVARVGDEAYKVGEQFGFQSVVLDVIAS